MNIVKFKFHGTANVFYGEDLQPETKQSVGIDLRACNTMELSVSPGERLKIHTGISIEPSPGFAGYIFSRSGLGAMVGLTVAQGVGVIDPDYRGELIVYLLNTSSQIRIVKPGERIAQLVILPYTPPTFVEVDTLSETERGEGGFGHTGVK